MEKFTLKMEECRTWKNSLQKRKNTERGKIPLHKQKNIEHGKNPLGKWQNLLIIWKILPLTGRTSFKNEISPPLGHYGLEHDLQRH
jgi:hypothetical protein